MIGAVEYLRIIKFRKVSVAMCLVFSCFTFKAAAENNNIFEFLTKAELNQYQVRDIKNKAIYPIRISRSMPTNNIGDKIRMPLPNGSFLSLKIDKKWKTENGDVQFIARFDKDGFAIITHGKDSTFANFSSAEHNFGISLDRRRKAVLIDHNESSNSVDLKDDMVLPREHSNENKLDFQTLTNTPAPSANNKSVVTVLAAYSPEFANGFANPVTRINQMIAFTNLAYERSGIHIKLELAYTEEIPFENNSDLRILLDQVTNGTGIFSDVPALRNQYYADTVVVLPFSKAGIVSGLAWRSGNRESLAFSVAQFAVWGSDTVFAHELGHTLGSGHERISVNPLQEFPCSGGFTGYSCGHGNGSKGTIMSYLKRSAWNHVFSNPTLNCAGEPCGIAQGKNNAADNSTSFNITGPLVAAFRDESTNNGMEMPDPEKNTSILVPIYYLLFED